MKLDLSRIFRRPVKMFRQNNYVPKFLGILSCLILGVTHAWGNPVAKESAVKVIQKPEDSKIIQATYASYLPGKPPLVQLKINIRLFNDSSESRWILIPYSFSSGHFLSSIDTLMEYQFGPGQGRLGKFMGTGDFQAVYLPAQGKLELRNLEVSCWDEACRPEKMEKAPFRFDVLSTPVFTIDDASASTWFQAAPLWPQQAVVDFQKATHSATHELPKGSGKKGILSLGNRIEVMKTTLQMPKKY